MPDNIITIAQTAAQQQGGGNPLAQMIPMFVIFGLIIFFMIRSQKKQEKKRKEMLNSIKVGDKIMTNGGIIGEIVKVKDDTYMIKVADKVNIEIVHSAVGNILGKDEKKENE